MRQVLLKGASATIAIKAISPNGTRVNATTLDNVAEAVITDGLGHEIPFYAKNFRYTVTNYQAAVKKQMKVTVPTVDSTKDYTVIFVKKGVAFNERNKWTYTVRANSYSNSDIAAQIAAYVEANKELLGLTASVSSNVVTVEAVENATDFTIVAADSLPSSAITVVSGHAFTPAVADEAYVMDCLSKAAADSGYEYTNKDNDPHLLYPGYGVSPLASANATDNGFDIVNIFCAEPRSAAKPLDVAVNQIIQVIFPRTSSTSASSACTSFTGDLDSLLGVSGEIPS